MKTSGNNVIARPIFTFITALAFLGMSAQSSRDIKFAKCAADDGMMEVQLGKLAQSKATSGDVKIHAQHMIDDHTKANEELKVLAAKKNIALPTAVSDKKQKKEQKLSQLNGKDFDKRYAKCMVHAHKKAICKFKKEAKRGKDAELKAWAQQKVPTLESHLSMWKEACKNLKKS